MSRWFDDHDWLRSAVLAALRAAFDVPHRRDHSCVSITDLATDVSSHLSPKVLESRSRELRGFRYLFPGEYLGGHAVIIARDRAAADAMFREHFAEDGEKFIADAEVEEFSLDHPNVPHSWDGDY